MLINVLNAILMLLSSLFILLLCFSIEYETGKDNNDPKIDIFKVDMVRGGKAVCVKREPINRNFIVVNEYDKGMFDYDATFISNVSDAYLQS